MNYRICEYCGAALDPGERCDCWLSPKKGKTAHGRDSRERHRVTSGITNRNVLPLYTQNKEMSIDYGLRAKRAAIISRISAFTSEECDWLSGILNERKR